MPKIAAVNLLNNPNYSRFLKQLKNENRLSSHTLFTNKEQNVLVIREFYENPYNIKNVKDVITYCIDENGILLKKTTKKAPFTKFSTEETITKTIIEYFKGKLMRRASHFMPFNRIDQELITDTQGQSVLKKTFKDEGATVSRTSTALLTKESTVL